MDVLCERRGSRILERAGHAEREFSEREFSEGEWIERVRDARGGAEPGHPHETAQLQRFVWSDTSRWYPPLLNAGVTVDRSTDLRLCHAILRASTATRGSRLAAAPASAWDDAPDSAGDPSRLALFDFDDRRAEVEADVAHETAMQADAVAESASPARLRLLLAAESAGALIAAEMSYAGLPWDVARHDRILTDLLGPRSATSARPARLETLAAEVRAALDAPDVNPDSPAELAKALARAGVIVSSTRSWDLKRVEHPVVAPLLEYKKLSRLFTANGWSWAHTWVRDGRFRPEYIPGGVVTGRWATRGGGALQLPRSLRAAAVADPGWKLVVADAAQLEPRILSGMSGDLAMARAGTDADLYAGIVGAGVLTERAQVKTAMLGAMYGATTGDAGRLMSRLARAFPQAIRLVEQAARAGEQGEQVSTLLGRSSPAASDLNADDERAAARARDWGRFTRNFVVQGTAAEWALCWMAGLRARLRALGPRGHALTDGPHLVYFLHDEVIVHSPTEMAEQVASAIRQAAVDAGRLLFEDFPVSFPVTTAIVDDYGSAK